MSSTVPLVTNKKERGLSCLFEMFLLLQKKKINACKSGHNLLLWLLLVSGFDKAYSGFRFLNPFPKTVQCSRHGRLVIIGVIFIIMAHLEL